MCRKVHLTAGTLSRTAEQNQSEAPFMPGKTPENIGLWFFTCRLIACFLVGGARTGALRFSTPQPLLPARLPNCHFFPVQPIRCMLQVQGVGVSGRVCVCMCDVVQPASSQPTSGLVGDVRPPRLCVFLRTSEAGPLIKWAGLQLRKVAVCA